MILRAILALWLGIGAAQAQTARVVSGEHADFTRLVIELPTASDWTVGRVPFGYGFAATVPEQPAYDLDRVWDRIPRTRLQSIRVDPADGVLKLTLACECHVFPFEYQPGMVVLDIKEGPPPPGSSFEAALVLAAPDQPAETAIAETYDWLSVRTRDQRAEVAEPVLPAGKGSLDLLRDELLAQISRGAAAGIVDMALPGKPPDPGDAQWGELPWTTIRVGESSGVTIRPEDGAQPAETACLADDQLDLAGWGAETAPSDLLSEVRGGLFGEFDRVTADSVLRAVRVHLYLGFGAEARVYADLLPDDPPESLPFYRSMSHLVDGDTDPQSPFLPMLGCDGAAALWAALASKDLASGPQVNRDAILRSFLALPPHLRLHLGPSLADRFLAGDDPEAARIIRDAVRRTPQSDPASVALMDAKGDLHANAVDRAKDHAETAVDAIGDDAESLVTLVEAHFQDGTPLDPQVALTLQTLVREAKGSGDEPALQRAMILALALSGDTDTAFAAAEGWPEAALDLWRVLPQRASDDAFLSHAVLPQTTPIPAVEKEVAQSIATRLVQLGFADPALQWLGPVQATDNPARRQLAAEAQLGRGDARTAAELLAGIETAEAEALRARALIQLGELAPAVASLRAAGAEDEAGRVLAWSQDWPAVETLPDSPWAEAARLALVAEPEGEAGLLGRSARLLDDSATMRLALSALLSAVPPAE